MSFLPFLKDFQDVEGLIRVGGLDPRSERVTQLFLKYGRWICMKKSSAPVPMSDQSDSALEFPVMPDFDSRPPRLDPQIMLKRCEETMPWRNAQPQAPARRAAEKIPVEFEL